MSFSRRTGSLILGLLMAAVPAFAGLDTGLVGHWEFEDNANDSSVEGNDGTANGGVTYVTGKVGKAASFDGVNDYIRVPNDASFNFGGGSFSVAVWIKPTASLDNARVVENRGTGTFGSNDGWQLKIRASGSRWHVRGATIDDGSDYLSCQGCTTSRAYGEWYHLTMIYENDESLRLYINGELEGDLPSGTLGSFDNTLPLVIGAALAHDGTEDTNSQFYEGLIDELRLYDRVLLDEEIRTLALAHPQLGDWESKSEGTIYTADTDGFVTAYISGSGCTNDTVIMFTNEDTDPNPNGFRVRFTGYNGGTIPVKKGDNWKVEQTFGSCGVTVHFIPLLPSQ